MIGRLLAALLILAATAAENQEFNALARILTDQSVVIDREGGVELRLGLSQGVPYRVYFLDEPRRLVMDFNYVDFTGLRVQDFDSSDVVTGVRFGAVSAGWSRMVLDIDRPLTLDTAALQVSDDGPATVLVRISSSSPAMFNANAGAPPGVQNFSEALKPALAPTARRQIGGRDLVVVLDPGHGGIDPGAQRDGVVEADLMLSFARELKELLLRSGGFDVVLTRNEDIFVPLEARVTMARRAHADLFLSLHADALVEGRASGSTIYTLSERASDIASQKLAERHDRSDLLAGVDLSGQGDEIAKVLMDLARVETAPRSNELAAALVAGLSNTVDLHKRPHLSAGFSVLKAPDIPSVLLELGFLSSQRDRDRLTDGDWRARAATGIRDGLQAWAISDAAEARLLRK